MKKCSPVELSVIFAGPLVTSEMGLLELQLSKAVFVTLATSWFPVAKLNSRISPAVNVSMAAQAV